MTRKHGYEDLIVWKKAIRLAKVIYVRTDSFPRSEIFGLINQMRRSAVSVPSNIAEGQARQHPKEFAQFLYHSLGSLAELDTQVLLSREFGYLNEIEKEDL